MAINQLLAMRVFVRVVETGSFNLTASQLSLPRSTVSKLVSDLEKHLGIRLLHRTTRTLSVTAEGRTYYAQAVNLIDALDQADSLVRGTRLKPSGHLRIDVPAIFAERLLIPRLPDFHQQYPDLTVAIGVSDRPINLVSEGVDCVIRLGELSDTSLIARKLMELEYVACASPAYLSRKGIPGSPGELQRGEHQMVGYFYAGSGKTEPLLFMRGDEHYEITQSAFSANGAGGIIALMLAGLGIGQPLRPFIQPLLDSGQLVTVLETWQRPAVPVHVVYPQNRHQSARLKVFVDWLIDTFRDAEVVP